MRKHLLHWSHYINSNHFEVCYYSASLCCYERGEKLFRELQKSNFLHMMVDTAQPGFHGQRGFLFSEHERHNWKATSTVKWKLFCVLTQSHKKLALIGCLRSTSVLTGVSPLSSLIAFSYKMCWCYVLQLGGAVVRLLGAPKVHPIELTAN